MSEVLIIGCGAAGMMAGIKLAEKGYKPVILEKNDKPGKKLFITGKGRCNLTNNCTVEELLENTVSNSKFMYSSFYGFDSMQTMDFFEGIGLRLKTERGGRVFPASDHSSDVISVLMTRLKSLHVEVRFNTEVCDLLTEEDETERKRVVGVTVKEKNGGIKRLACGQVVVATGGLSYPLTGSTGDGIRWAKELGMKITGPRPALVPMVIREEVCRELMGLALKNVRVSYTAQVKNKRKTVYTGFGEMLFTHFGVSGPVILSASSHVGGYLDADLQLSIDLKPALSPEQLDDRLLRDFSQNINRQFHNSLSELLPKRMIPVIVERSGIEPDKRVNEISRDERSRLVAALKDFRLHVDGFRDFGEAIITQGGISVKELNPRTMEAKNVEGLRFIGEVIDVDAVTGGFNLQIAWSTAASLE